MDKTNFNGIDKITTPAQWKTKAIAIPCTHIITPTPKKTGFYKTVAAFCVTILCLVCTVVFFNTNNNPPVTVKPSSKAENPTQTTTAQPSIENPTNPTENLEIVPTIPSTDETTPSVEQPTEKPSESETQPTEKPTEKPTESTTQPTEDPSESTSSQLPTQPSNPPEIKNVIFDGETPVADWASAENIDVFCKVYDANGVLLGSNDLFDEQHRADYLGEFDNYEYYAYYASDKGLSFKKGYYTYIFYRPNGVEICRGTQFVS